MITAVLAALATAAAPADAPPQELVLVRVEPTRLVARNLGTQDRVLLFAASDGVDAPVGRRLRAGQSLRLDYPRRGLEGVHLEVLDLEGPVWSTTGALPLAPGRGERARTLFCTPPSALAQTHGTNATPREELAPSESLLPAKAQPLFQRASTAAAGPAHVPGPKPTPPKPRDTPPELEKDPLPPL